MTALQNITDAARTCVRLFVDDRTDASGLVSIDSFAKFARMTGLQAQPWQAALKVRASDGPGFQSCYYSGTHAITVLCKQYEYPAAF